MNNKFGAAKGSSIDPYHKWLGIPPDQRPPTFYQLLGIAVFERDLDVIHAAVIRQSSYVRNFQAGPYGSEATRILNEIAEAKTVLTDPEKRQKYDAELANRQSPSPDEGGAPKQYSFPRIESSLPSKQATRKPKKSLWLEPRVISVVLLCLIVGGFLITKLR